MFRRYATIKQYTVIRNRYRKMSRTELTLQCQLTDALIDSLLN